MSESADAYKEVIKRAENLGDMRQVAVAKGNFGSVRLHQHLQAEAFELLISSKDAFEALGEPITIAESWQRIGAAYMEVDDLDRSEQAYRQALAIAVQHKSPRVEVSCVYQLGHVYRKMGRLEEAALFFRQAADISVKLQYVFIEGGARGNLANILITLRRHNEARRELHRAIECKQPFGHGAQPWTTWASLHDLEQATGNAQAAEAARGQAISSYLAYRRAGGESQSTQARLFALVFQGIQQGATTEAEQYLDELPEDDDPLWFKTLLAGLRAILRGDRDPALAADPNLDYLNAAELQLLLEALHGK